MSRGGGGVSGDRGGGGHRGRGGGYTQGSDGGPGGARHRVNDGLNPNRQRGLTGRQE